MNQRSVAAVRLVLRTGALVFGASALALILVPAFFNQLLGLVSTSELEWAMRMIGITLVALAGNMYSVASRGTDAAVYFSGRLMLGSASALGIITLLIPASHNWFTLSYAAVGFGFGIAYLIALTRK